MSPLLGAKAAGELHTKRGPSLKCTGEVIARKIVEGLRAPASHDWLKAVMLAKRHSRMGMFEAIALAIAYAHRINACVADDFAADIDFRRAIRSPWARKDNFVFQRNVWRISAVGDVILLKMSDTDLELLARYTEQHAEDAFTELVRQTSWSGLFCCAAPGPLAATATKAIAMTTLQKALVAAVLAAAIGTAIYEARQASSFRDRVNSLQQQRTALSDQLNKNRDDAMRQLAAMRAENERLNRNAAELVKLRGQMAALKREAEKVPSLENELTQRRNAGIEEVPPGASKLIFHHPYLPRVTLSDKGVETPRHALETMLWADMTRNDERLREVIIPGATSVLIPEHPPISTVKGVQVVSQFSSPGRETKIAAIVEEELYSGGLSAPPTTVQKIRSWNFIQTNGQWKVTGGKAW